MVLSDQSGQVEQIIRGFSCEEDRGYSVSPPSPPQSDSYRQKKSHCRQLNVFRRFDFDLRRSAATAHWSSNLL